jgi:hypothetical protein
MAQMTNADYAALTDGYAESERVARAGGRAQYVNPHPWGSRLHRFFELGYYIQEKGMTLGARDYWQSGRGNTITSPAGLTLKLWCDKSGLGIQRIA